MDEKELEQVDWAVSDSYACTLAGPEHFEYCEYCFQFDDDEPKVFSSTIEGCNLDKKLILTIENKAGGNIVFYDGKGKTFKIFARKKEEKQ